MLSDVIFSNPKCVPQSVFPSCLNSRGTIGSVLEPENENLAASRRSVKLLVLSNDDQFCALMRSYLEHLGFSVFICTSADRAERSFLRNSNIDIWLVDVQALGLDAVYCAVKVRDLYPSVPIILLSEPGRGESPLQRMLSLNWTWIQKPLELQDMLALIERALSKLPEPGGVSNKASDFLDWGRSSYSIDSGNRNCSCN